MLNRKLYDSIITSQVYLEGYKNFHIREFRKALPEFVKDIKILFGQVKYKNLDEMTKRELNEFKRKVKETNKKFFDNWSKKLLKELEAFTEVDYKINKAILANHFEPKTNDIDATVEANAKEDEENKIVPFGWIYNNETDKIRARIFASIIPGIGVLPADFLAGLSVYSLKQIETEINKGFANRESLEQILENLVGTKDNNYKDGIFVKLDRASAAVSNTIIQHITSIIAPAVFATAFNRYIWLSVMDSRTSDICISRNKRIYYYGKGPLPPAHAHCRSKTAPYMGFDFPDSNLNLWASSQPKAVQEYIKNGYAPLNLKAFGSKIEQILTPLGL